MAEPEKEPVDDVEYDDDGNAIVADTAGDEQGDDAASEDSEGEAEFDDNAEPNVPIRADVAQHIIARTDVAQHIIARKNKKIKKLESQNNAYGYDDDPYDADDDEGLKPDDVDNRIQEHLDPIYKKISSDADQKELDALFAETPEATKYAKHIKAYQSHEVYKGVPPAVIYHHLAFQNALEIGAKKKDAADHEANQNSGGGRDVQIEPTSVDGLPTPQAIENMSEEEFEALQSKALQGGFVK